MESYFDYVPKELIVNILSYVDPLKPIPEKSSRNRQKRNDRKLDPIKELSTSKFFEAFPDILFTDKDWGYLFNLRYPQYFSKNLYTKVQCFDIQKIYLEMLLLEPIITQKYFVDHINKRGDMPYIGYVKTYKEILQYLSYENFIELGIGNIAELDDVEIFKLSFPHLSEMEDRDSNEIFVRFLDLDSINILKGPFCSFREQKGQINLYFRKSIDYRRRIT